MPPKNRIKNQGKQNEQSKQKSESDKSTSSSGQRQSESGPNRHAPPMRIKLGSASAQQDILPRQQIRPVPKDQIVDATIQTTRCLRYRVTFAEPELTVYSGTLVEGKQTQANFGSVRLNCNISLDSAKLQLLSSLSQCMLQYLEQEGNGQAAQSGKSSNPVNASSSIEAEQAAANKHAEVQIGFDDRGMYIASNAGAIDRASYLKMLKWVRRQPDTDPDHERPLTRAIARIQSLFSADEQREDSHAKLQSKHEEAIQVRQTSRDRRIDSGKLPRQEALDIFNQENQTAQQKLAKDRDDVLAGVIEQSPWYKNVVERTIDRTNQGELANLYHFLKALRNGDGIAASMSLIAEHTWAGELSIVHAELRVVRAAWLIGSGKLLLGGAKRACWGCYNVIKELDQQAINRRQAQYTQASTSTLTTTHPAIPTRPRSASLPPPPTAISASGHRARSTSMPPHPPATFDILRLIDDDIPGGAFPKSYCGVSSSDRTHVDEAPPEDTLAANLTRRRSVILFK